MNTHKFQRNTEIVLNVRFQHAKIWFPKLHVNMKSVKNTVVIKTGGKDVSLALNILYNTKPLT